MLELKYLTAMLLGIVSGFVVIFPLVIILYSCYRNEEQ